MWGVVFEGLNSQKLKIDKIEGWIPTQAQSLGGKIYTAARFPLYKGKRHLQKWAWDVEAIHLFVEYIARLDGCANSTLVSPDLWDME